jgi:SAM-dependent methyltransferase
VNESTREKIVANKELWDAWAELHVESDFYDVEGFLADPHASPLDVIVRELVGDVSAKRLLHLQCHFGMDTLRLALMGAIVTGVDFSPKAIAAARALAAAAGIEATFVESDVTQLAEEVPRDAFDVVFTSYGAISWLPALRPWAEAVASRLVNGGVLRVVDMHPTLWIFDEDSEEPTPVMRYSYFSREALRWEERGSYAAPDSDFESVSYSWQHTFEEIVGSLVGAGLSVESLREYPRIAWQHMPSMIRDDEGLWMLPPGAVDIPLLFSVTARKANRIEAE